MRSRAGVSEVRQAFPALSNKPGKTDGLKKLFTIPALAMSGAKRFQINEAISLHPRQDREDLGPRPQNQNCDGDQTALHQNQSRSDDFPHSPCHIRGPPGSTNPRAWRSRYTKTSKTGYQRSGIYRRPDVLDVLAKFARGPTATVLRCCIRPNGNAGDLFFSFFFSILSFFIALFFLVFFPPPPRLPSRPTYLRGLSTPSSQWY